MTPNRRSANRHPAALPHREWAADTLDNLWADTDGTEALDEGGTHLLDLVAAVDYLARGVRHDFTVWDALEEALRWWLADHAALTTGALDTHDSPQPDDDDPLSDRLDQLVKHIEDNATATAADVLHQAIRRWATETADRHNAGYHWPHPTPRGSFPPPLTDP